MSPSKFLQDQGGIEGIIQEAARGVYRRGEKWGVAKALRGAVQGLQSASGTPSLMTSAPRWSLDTGQMIKDDSAQLTARIYTLEQKNRSLARLLEKAMQDLFTQQQDFAKNKAEAAADALSLAIAKVQFVQVYLDNPAMPLPNEDQALESGPKEEASEKKSLVEAQQAMEASDVEVSPTPKSVAKDPRKKGRSTGQASTSQSPMGSPRKQEKITAPTDSIPSVQTSEDGNRHERLPNHRPVLAQSSFSWILGEDQRKSDFVAASPFTSEKERFRGKAGFLFGDGATEDTRSESAAPKGRTPSEKEGQEEAINLDTMEGVKERYNVDSDHE